MALKVSKRIFITWYINNRNFQHFQIKCQMYLMLFSKEAVGLSKKHFHHFNSVKKFLKNLSSKYLILYNMFVFVWTDFKYQIYQRSTLFSHIEKNKQMHRFICHINNHLNRKYLQYLKSKLQFVIHFITSTFDDWSLYAFISCLCIYYECSCAC